MTEGGINFGLTKVLSGEITFQDGAVEQSDFDAYQVLRISQAPDIDVHITDTGKELAAWVKLAFHLSLPPYSTRSCCDR